MASTVHPTTCLDLLCDPHADLSLPLLPPPLEYPSDDEYIETSTRPCRPFIDIDILAQEPYDGLPVDDAPTSYNGVDHITFDFTRKRKRATDTLSLEVGCIIDHKIFQGERNNIQYQLRSDDPGVEYWAFESLLPTEAIRHYWHQQGILFREQIFYDSQVDCDLPMPSCDKCERVYTTDAAANIALCICDCDNVYHELCSECHKHEVSLTARCFKCNSRLVVSEYKTFH